jgi:hypothetical protein
MGKDTLKYFYKRPYDMMEIRRKHDLILIASNILG